MVKTMLCETCPIHSIVIFTRLGAAPRARTSSWPWSMARMSWVQRSKFLSKSWAHGDMANWRYLEIVPGDSSKMSQIIMGILWIPENCVFFMRSWRCQQQNMAQVQGSPGVHRSTATGPMGWLRSSWVSPRCHAGLSAETAGGSPK